MIPSERDFNQYFCTHSAFETVCHFVRRAEAEKGSADWKGRAESAEKNLAEASDTIAGLDRRVADQDAICVGIKDIKTGVIHILYAGKERRRRRRIPLDVWRWNLERVEPKEAEHV